MSEMVNKGRRIALLDDNDFHLLLMKRALLESNAEHDLFIYRSGKALLDDINHKKFDLIISELVLSDIKGLDLIQRISGQKYGPPIIIVTSGGNEQAAVTAIKSGAIDYIAKQPGYINDFSGAVERAYQKHCSAVRLQRREARSREMEKADLISTLVSTLNHEINNPLMAILGTVDLLLNSAELPREEIRHKLKMIERSTRRIEKITRKMENLISTSVHQTPVGPMLKLKGKGSSRFRKPVADHVSE